MNQIKMGRFISECRKNKKMTQEELGNKLGIGGKSVSKWERGVNVPDISILEELSNELGVTINELLNGERIEYENKNLINNNTTIDGIKFYTDSIKNKNKIKMSLVVMSLIFIFLVIFTINDYNKFHIYSLKSDDEHLLIDGYFIFNPEEKILVISNINYIDENTGTNLEQHSKEIQLSLVSNNKTIFNNNTDSSDELKPISNILNNFSVNIVDKNNDNFNLINKNDLNNIYLYLNYVDELNIEHGLKFKVNVNKNFSNNKLFY